MTQITATELARNLRQVLDRMEFTGEEVVVTRNNQPIARILPGGRRMTALEAMADLYRTLPEEAAAGWIEDSRRGEDDPVEELRDPWAS